MSRDVDVTALAEMCLTDLRSLWRRLHDGTPPRFSLELMRLALAYGLQDEDDGRLTRKNGRRLKRLREVPGDGGKKRPPSPTVALKPGATLVREWQGRRHTVTVRDDGFVYRDRHYRSLSAIARDITGTRWSGPRFFGLRRTLRGKGDE